MSESASIGTDYPSITYGKPTGCKKIYVIVAFKQDAPDKIEFIRIVGNTDGSCGNSFYEALADMTTFAVRRIRNEHEARAIIKNLRFHRCNNIIPNKDHIVSCADAVGQVLQHVLIKEDKCESRQKEA